ncbi:hypothetical protein PVAP13_1NG428438 [Panicum virgatum]|uniref:Uncharacterized protein n=1 Tax=Panicum virgatum TaxID=38727 RepID=A0A8T0WMN4_PANVG|nr:hypothetical protein PVAP13_1NG428438 [Panicum virgatum]
MVQYIDDAKLPGFSTVAQEDWWSCIVFLVMLDD